MTRLVATVTGETPDELYARAQAAADEADVVEVRLDGPSGLPWDLRGFFSLRVPTIATVRHADDGGQSHADDATRLDLLRRALRAGATYADVELHAEGAAALVVDAHAMEARTIVSVHDLAGTPKASDILNDLRTARAMGASIAKIAATVEGPQDAAHLVEAALAARDEGIPYALMAVNDAFLRALAPRLGMALAYGAPAFAPPATRGQLPVQTLRALHARMKDAPQVTAATRAAYLLGHPVSHSLSPAMQNAAFPLAGVDACYLALDVEPRHLGDVVSGLRATNPLGLNVTVPHKVAIIEHLDEMAQSALLAEAVNTIVVQDDGRFVGHNTDGSGALDALADAKVEVKGRRVLLLGAGGAARALAHALAGAGAELTLSNRTRERAAPLARRVGAALVDWSARNEAAKQTDLLVNATTLGLAAKPARTNVAFGALDQFAFPVALDALPEHAAVMDCVYAPGGTPLVREARRSGRFAVAGESMLLHQGARAFKLWTGKDAPLSAMRHVLEDSA